MDQRQFIATVLAVILLGISVAMGVNMVVVGIDDSTRAMNRTAPSQDEAVTMLIDSPSFDNTFVTWNTFPHIDTM